MKLILRVILILFPFWCCAQTNSKSSLQDYKVATNFDSIAILSFIDSIETKYPVRFFYKQRWLNNIFVRQKQVPISLVGLLDDTFRGTNLHYIVDRSNILITSDYIINTTLPDDFFVIKNHPLTATDSIVLPYSFLHQNIKKENEDKTNVLVMGTLADKSVNNRVTISGIVKDDENGEPIVGAQVSVRGNEKGTVTDVFGHYTIVVLRGDNELHFKYFGKKEIVIPVVAYKDYSMNVNLSENLVLLKEVVVKADKENKVRNLNVGVQKLNIAEIKLLPKMLGETDIIKSALLLPGVQTVGEGSSGFNVRGGSADQNLILFDDAPVFNSSHLFGFFSAFNAETVKDFELYKCGIPARFGGRVSSVFDITARQGNLKKISLSGGISPITGKLTIEGPIIKDKLSFIVGARSTYSNWVLKQLKRPEFKNSQADFYDINAKLSYDIDKNNFLSITAYNSKDYFKLNSDTAYHYNNQCARFLYKHTFNPKLYGRLSAVYSDYTYNVSSDRYPITSFNLIYNIKYKSVKADFNYIPGLNHKVNFGVEAIRYDMTPGNFTPLSSTSDIREMKLPNEQGIESGLFVHDEFEITPKLTVSGGLRYAMFSALGPGKVYTYNSNLTKSIDSRIDSTIYTSNNIIKTYGGPEVRLSARYLLGADNSVKLSYSRIHQFLHMLTNSSAISPTDVWKLSDANIKPLIGDQIAIGYYHNFLTNTLEVSAEAYYKVTQNTLDFKGGSKLLMNPNLDVDLLSGVGRAYGFELMIKKMSGIINGWISYTYSRSELKVDGKFAADRINNGHYYPSDYDKPHDLNLVVNYKYTRRITITNTFTYSTGRPITYPVAKYSFRDIEVMHYSDRNEYRIPDYMRWDFSVNVDENLLAKKYFTGSWSFGIYNVLGRDNVYSVFFKSTPRGVKAYQLSIFAQPIVNVTYNFKF